jgi:hypothetical protein
MLSTLAPHIGNLLPPNGSVRFQWIDLGYALEAPKVHAIALCATCTPAVYREGAQRRAPVATLNVFAMSGTAVFEANARSLRGARVPSRNSRLDSSRLAQPARLVCLLECRY